MFWDAPLKVNLGGAFSFWPSVRCVRLIQIMNCGSALARIAERPGSGKRRQSYWPGCLENRVLACPKTVIVQRAAFRFVRTIGAA
jgi:hypothetical protein